MYGPSIIEDECNYQVHDRQLKEQFINGINNEMMTTQKIKDLTTVRKTGDITNKQVLDWAKRVEAESLEGNANKHSGQ